jgi:hypothetical protein
MDSNNLGGAIPARYISLLDEEDQVERLYPQALVKQFNLPTQPAAYADSDIIAQFNSLIDWYIPDNNHPIGKNQYDLLDTVLHEIIHGLGFVSSWRNDIDGELKVPTNGLIPYPIFESDVSSDPLDIPNNGKFKFLAFYETIFDKFIIAINNNNQTRLSGFAKILNQFSGINQNFTKLSDFNAELHNSPQYDAAKQVLSLSTTKDSLIFMPSGGRNIKNDGVVLETKLNPYRLGTSISHVDSDIYNDSPDFLMRRVSDDGVTMHDLIAKSGNLTGSAIGPKLLQILGSIGYNLADNPIKSASASNKKPIIINFTIIFLCILINHVL